MPRARRDSHAALFRAAAHEFAERGYDAARVDRIAARARVNKAMLYYHYGSKGALYEEILRDLLRVVERRARAIADGPGSPGAKLDAWVLTVVEEAGTRPWFPPIMLREVASGASHVGARTLGMMDAVYAAVRDIIVEGQRTGVFDDVDPLLTHFTVLPAILIFFARQRAFAGRRSTRAVAATRDLDEFVVHMQRSVRRMVRHPGRSEGRRGA